MAEITSEYLQNQLIGLEQQQVQLQANANALQGAILFTKQLLQECAAAPEAPVAEPIDAELVTQ